jgi:hypothetical protein
MAVVVLSTHNVVNFPDGGGHFWVYLQYVEGLRRAGCEVYWLEQFRPYDDESYNTEIVTLFIERMARRGLGDRVVLYSLPHGRGQGDDAEPTYINLERQQAEAILRGADLMLNFNYRMRPSFLARFRRTALIDIDPGLLQFWVGIGQIPLTPHDVYLTTGETVGTPQALFPDCGVPWVRIHPPICLELWPVVADSRGDAFTTVASWWSGEAVKGVVDGQLIEYDNTKRIAFLDYLTLPERTPQPLELALLLAKDDQEEQRLLEQHGWRVRDSRVVTSTPESYQAYVQGSRGEFSCAKPSCMKLQNAWVSDRTLCYMASGKPAVVQDTGPSTVLPNGLGMLRFSSIEQAVDAIDAVNTDYARHCRAARELVEAHFDASAIVRRILDTAL